MPAPRQALPPMKKDTLISKTVKVITGPWKGHQGYVSSVNDNMLSIVLHSRPKPISIDKAMVREIEVVGRPRQTSDGSRTPAYAGNQTPSYSGSRTPAYSGSQTPMYGTGSRTPGYDGGMTPSHDGGRTPAWDAGSRTPSYHTPGWNAKLVFFSFSFFFLFLLLTDYVFGLLF